MKKSIKSILFAILIAFSITSCTKEGPAGPAGKDGTNGTNGNANVISTNTITITSWNQSGADWYTQLSVPAITQDVVDKGVVMVYIKYSNQWVALPDVNGINTTLFAFYTGGVDIINANSDWSLPSNPGTQTFRIVIIPASAMGPKTQDHIRNYPAIKKEFSLQD